MLSILRAIAISIIVSSLAACGGGGGGGGGGNSRSAETGVRLIHSAIDASPIQIFSSVTPAQAVQSARFGQTVLFAELPRGAQTLDVKRGATDTLFSSTIEVEKSQHYSILFFENPSDLSPRFALVLDPEIDVPGDMAAVRIGHAAIGAGSISAFTSSNETVASRVPYGAFSDYVTVPAATTGRISFARDTDGRTVHSTAIQLSGGHAYTLVLSGQIDYFVTAPLLEDR